MFGKIVKRLGVNRFFDSSINENLVGIYDTSVGSLNVGDEIINRSAMDQLAGVFPYEQFVKASTHDGTSSIGIHYLNEAKERLVCGSNILTGRMFVSGQWNIGPVDVFRMRKLITLGVGWVDYQNSTSLYSRWAYNHLLSKHRLHSVRDEYTKLKLNELGFDNVLNTSCVTMWKLTPEHCGQITRKKADTVVFTLTDYRQDIGADTALVNILLRNYKKVYFWLQGKGDRQYFNMLQVKHDDIQIIPPQLDRYDALLSEGGVDFVGTRLHAGIRSLQFGNRTIIVGVDNRAKEKKKDFNLLVLDRGDIEEQLEDTLNADLDMNISIPQDKIAQWKAQFE